MTKCKIVQVACSNKKLKPTLVEFEHGSLNKKTFSKMKCDVIFEDDCLSTTYLAWRNAEKSLILRGTKARPEDQMNQTLLMIRNRKTNKIRVVATDQLIVSNIINHDELFSSNSTNVVSSENGVSLQEMARLFGSKKAQRQAALNSKLEMNQEILKSKLEDSISGIKIGVEDLNESQEESYRVLPRCNDKAKKVEEVYDLFDIIPEHVLESLTETVDQIIENPPKKPDKEFSNFFVKCINLSPIVLETPKQLKCLLFVDSILKFFSIQNRNLKPDSIYGICPNSKYVRNHIMKEFSISSDKTRLRPLAMRDKAVCHSLICLMVAFQYKIPSQVIQIAFPKTSAKRLQEFGKALRFTISSIFWTIKLPLPSIVSFQKGSKKGKR